ncbi:MAG: DUF4190 domain-containing protein [Planctomycetota bacterium]
MEAGDAQSSGSFVVTCQRCARPISVRQAWIGRDLKCPHCALAFHVPEDASPESPARATPAAPATRARFHFACPRCDSPLEAHSGMCRQVASCPTCGARLHVPYLDPRTNQPGPVTLLETEEQDPTPLHAYAASGAQAPRLERQPDGSMLINCPRCGTRCAVEADNCSSCGAPFTIAGAPAYTDNADTPRATAALVCGIISAPLCKLILPALLAIAFGIMSLNLGSSRPASRIGVIGLILGLASLTAGVTLWIL